MYDPLRHRGILFGGDAGVYTNDTWILDLNGTPAWRRAAPIGSPPLPRFECLAVYDNSRDRMIVFAGYDNGTLLNDVWALSFSDPMTWTMLSPVGATPPALWGPAGFYDPAHDQVLVCCGSSSGGASTINDVWTLSLAGTPTWAHVTPSGAQPTPRFLTAGVYTPALESMFLFAGHDAGTQLGDTWILDAGHDLTWAQLHPGSTPPARQNHTAVLRSQDGRMIVFGGLGPGFTPLADVWALGTQFALSFTVIGSGRITRVPDLPTYPPGAIVQLSAESNPGWTFFGWSGDATGTNPTTSITMDSDKSVTASFVQDHYVLSVTSVGNGAVTRLPDQPTYLYGDAVDLTAVPGPNWTFSGWSGDAAGSANPITIVMNGNKAVTASFTARMVPDVHVLYPNGGEILVVGSDYKFAWDAVDSTGITGVDLSLSRDSGATYESIATSVPNTGSFVWEAGRPCGNTGPEPRFSAKFRVVAHNTGGNSSTDESDAPFAIYDLNPPHTLGVTVVGKGTVLRDPDLPVYDNGTSVTLTATPVPGWTFVSWSGDTSSDSNPLVLEMAHNMNIVAKFRDAVAPEVHVVYPDGGQVLVAGSRYKLAWGATDNEGVVFVDLALSRDSGATYEPIASSVPNTGTYVWLASRPGGNTGSDVTFAALLRVAAHDSADNVGTDVSDAPFAIYDLNPLSVSSPRVGFGLQSIEPNPIADQAVITYSLASDAAIRLTVLDLQGRQMAVIADGIRTVGVYRATWTPCSHGGCVPSGVYFLRYVTPSGTFVRRVAVAR